MKKMNLQRVCFLFTIMFLFVAATLNAQTKTASVEGIDEYILENGLKVLLFQDRSSQTITVNITYRVGSRHEGYGEKGMAHLLEHMVFKGTPNHPNIPEELTSHGARPNGTTWYDRTNYFETFNATDENLDWALDLEADRMVNSYIAKKDLESEFSVVRNEFESGENSPSNVLMDGVISASYLWHNYGNTTIGNKSDIERVPIENLKAFYKKYYRPDNAVLMVTGKFDTEKTLDLINKKFGVLKNPDTALVDVPTIEPEQDGEKRITLSRVGDLQIVAASYHTPAGSSIDYASVSIAENILTDEPSGRLYKELVEGKKASSLWSFSPFTKEPGFLYINVDVPSTMSLEVAENTLLTNLDNFASKPITAQELQRAKGNLLKQIDQINRNSSYLGTYMSEFIGAGDWRLSFINRDRIEAATLEQVNAAIKKYFIKTNRTVGKFIPTKDPVRVGIPHTENLQELVVNYKGKKSLGEGEAFDVSFDSITKRLDLGTLTGTNIKYGFIKKKNRGKTVTLNFTFRNGNVAQLSNLGLSDSYTARMLNKGTTTKTRQNIEDELSALKSSIFFNGSNGRTSVSINSTEENLMATLALMTDMIKNPSFNKEEFDKLKAEDLANLEANKNDPQYLVSNKIRRINQKYQKGHPLYVESLEENAASIAKLTINDLKKYHQDFYGISNSASLVAIGDLDETKLKQFFQTEFKNFTSTKTYTAIPNAFTENKGTSESIITPDKKNAFTLGVLSANISQDDKEFAALEMAGTIFGGGFLNSRIANRLRQKDGVSYGAGGMVSVDGNKDDKNSTIYVYAIYAPQNAAKVQLGFKEEIALFLKDGITQEELDSAIKGWVQAENVSRAKDAELSSVINDNMYYNRDLNFQKNIEENVKKLTVDDVNKVIKKYFKNIDDWSFVNGGDFKNEINANETKKID
ncbi:pitrilysin family protein [uncultured Polaribacter sp.]|uniref:M16 family metallopeptidase n=1 Tax=uncultured Polaribacter sp. TaxID=174711 RepID=UPI0030D91153